MALTPSHRPTREWPLLVLTLALVALVCLPLYQALVADQDTIGFGDWTAEQWGRLLLGPEQIACYVCFTWAVFILFSRYVELRRQRRGFTLGMLPIEEGARILQEDARPLQRKLDQITETWGPFILANMIRTALAKFATSRSSEHVNDTIKTQAEVDHGRLVTSLATVNYLAWAIPAIGFLGTVRGLAGSMTMASTGGERLKLATRHLSVAFDCTLVALAVSLALMFLIHMLQRDEEALVLDCQQFCLEHLANRLYEPEGLGDAGGSFGARSPQLSTVITHPEKLTR